MPDPLPIIDRDHAVIVLRLYVLGLDNRLHRKPRNPELQTLRDKAAKLLQRGCNEADAAAMTAEILLNLED